MRSRSASACLMMLLLLPCAALGWVPEREGAPKVEGHSQTLLVMHDGQKQTMLWSATVNADATGKAALVFAIPTPPEKVQRLPLAQLDEATKVAQLSWLDTAKKRGDADGSDLRGALVGPDALSVHTLTTQGAEAAVGLNNMLADLGLGAVPEKTLKPWADLNWTFAAVSWEAKQGMHTLPVLRMDFTSPVPVFPLGSIALDGRADVFQWSATAFDDEHLKLLEKSGFAIAVDRRSLGPNPKKSVWVVGQSSFYLRNLQIGPKSLFLERLSAQRGFVMAGVVADLSKTRKKWKLDPFLGDAKANLEAPTVVAAIPEPPSRTPDAGVQPDAGEQNVQAPLVPEELGEVLEGAGDLDWTMIMGAAGLVFFFGAVMAVQVRRWL